MGISTKGLFRLRILLPFTVSPLGAESFTEVNEAVCTGSIVSLEYTLTLDDESVLESNVVKEPMTYMQGVHEIVSGLASCRHSS